MSAEGLTEKESYLLDKSSVHPFSPTQMLNQNNNQPLESNQQITLAPAQFSSHFRQSYGLPQRSPNIDLHTLLSPENGINVGENQSQLLEKDFQDKVLWSTKNNLVSPESLHVKPSLYKSVKGPGFAEFQPTENIIPGNLASHLSYQNLNQRESIKCNKENAKRVDMTHSAIYNRDQRSSQMSPLFQKEMQERIYPGPLNAPDDLKREVANDKNKDVLSSLIKGDKVLSYPTVQKENFPSHFVAEEDFGNNFSPVFKTIKHSSSLKKETNSSIRQLDSPVQSLGSGAA